MSICCGLRGRYFSANISFSCLSVVDLGTIKSLTEEGLRSSLFHCLIVINASPSSYSPIPEKSETKVNNISIKTTKKMKKMKKKKERKKMKKKMKKYLGQCLVLNRCIVSCRLQDRRVSSQSQCLYRG